MSSNLVDLHREAPSAGVLGGGCGDTSVIAWAVAVLSVTSNDMGVRSGHGGTTEASTKQSPIPLETVNWRCVGDTRAI